MPFEMIAFDGFRGFGPPRAMVVGFNKPLFELQGFAGSSALQSEPVARLQKAIVDGGIDTIGVDGRYGLGTHAAIIRAAKAILEPAGLTTTTCRSNCNTLRERALGVCATCLEAWVGNLGGRLPGWTPSVADVDAVVQAYKTWLPLYVADTGESGDPDLDIGVDAQVNAGDISVADVAQIDGGGQNLDVGGGEAVGEDTGGDQPIVLVAKKAGMPWFGWLLLAGAATAGGWWIWKSMKGQPAKKHGKSRRVEFVRSHYRVR